MKENIDPKMHTAEHILNQTMVRMFNSGRCFSAHIEKKKSKCDYHFDRILTESELISLEDEINKIISRDLPVSEGFLDKAGAQAIYDKYCMGTLPDNNGQDYRIIYVGDYDAIPCYGPHISSTGALGSFKIVSANQAEKVLRIRYKLN
jgi:misacylated tRNA(Ala) deacylase